MRSAPRAGPLVAVFARRALPCAMKGHQGGGRIQRTTSKIVLPSTPLDRALYLLVFVLWCTVGMTWMSARARLMSDEITMRLSQSNGRRSVLKEIDWWRTGRAKLTRSRGIQVAGRFARHAAEDTGVASTEQLGPAAALGTGADAAAARDKKLRGRR